MKCHALRWCSWLPLSTTQHERKAASLIKVMYVASSPAIYAEALNNCCSLLCRTMHTQWQQRIAASSDACSASYACRTS
jgi:hypothetical protein